jgi:hypothetical protein
MHTLKEILAEPQTMYDGGMVRMADGGDTTEVSRIFNKGGQVIPMYDGGLVQASAKPMYDGGLV